ncbi:hypothetical protein APS58_p00016 (plasmid) [Paracidovorax citrulli]|nr:hypothetical protein APS58_p00016 [Paracidovorax citrulli]
MRVPVDDQVPEDLARDHRRRRRPLGRTRSPRACGRLGMPARPARRPPAAGPGPSWWTSTCRAGHTARRAHVRAPVDDHVPEDLAGAGRRGRLLDRTRSSRACGRLGMPARPARRPRAAGPGPGWWTSTCRAGHTARRAHVRAPFADQVPEDLARDRRRWPPRPAARSHQVTQDLRPPRHAGQACPPAAAREPGLVDVGLQGRPRRPACPRAGARR